LATKGNLPTRISGSTKYTNVISELGGERAFPLFGLISCLTKIALSIEFGNPLFVSVYDIAEQCL
jgi:hypothetical protein